MSGRARVYVAIAAARHLALGLCCLLIPEYFTSPSYAPIKGALFIPTDLAMVAWGWTILALGVLCVIPALTGNVRVARMGLLFSVFMTALWFGGFLWAACVGLSAGPLGIILLGAITAKDTVQLADPMRTPFEDWGRGVAHKIKRR